MLTESGNNLPISTKRELAGDKLVFDITVLFEVFKKRHFIDKKIIAKE